ncbi:wd repeat [Anaeramoeba flamelloides]|uniref:Wd repeat n=1 Tax=Anaeramoeba flamelloides TaxID=1746091 RepID=A0ABQ8Y503_9EUKA|nr:wd repeat [Anaeramoeba flamelloides]
MGNKELKKIQNKITNVNKQGELDLSGDVGKFNAKGQEVIFKLICSHKEITSLNLDGNGLTKLPSALSKLTELKALSLKNNNFDRIPSCLFKMTWLQTIDLSNNSITLIPTKFKDLTKIEQVSFQGNPIKRMEGLDLNNKEHICKFLNNQPFQKIENSKKKKLSKNREPKLLFIFKEEKKNIDEWEGLLEKAFDLLDHSNLPSKFLCPVSLEIMIDPVTTSDGISYEREQIEWWFEKHATSPKTNQPLKNKKIVSNTLLRLEIIEFINNLSMFGIELD